MARFRQRAPVHLWVFWESAGRKITGFIFNRQPTKNRGRVSLFTIKAGDALEFAEVESEDGGHGRVAPRAWGVSQGPLSLATAPRLTWILYVATTAPHWTLTMPVSITDSSEFERLTQSIASDMQSLSFHWTLYNKLQDALDTYEPEFNESQTFWSLTFEAHHDVSLFRLCRLYDQRCSALNLKNWLVALHSRSPEANVRVQQQVEKPLNRQKSPSDGHVMNTLYDERYSKITYLSLSTSRQPTILHCVEVHAGSIYPRTGYSFCHGQ